MHSGRRRAILASFLAFQPSIAPFDSWFVSLLFVLIVSDGGGDEGNEFTRVALPGPMPRQ